MISHEQMMINAALEDIFPLRGQEEVALAGWVRALQAIGAKTTQGTQMPPRAPELTVRVETLGHMTPIGSR